jgi:hypothetical protein
VSRKSGAHQEVGMKKVLIMFLFVCIGSVTDLSAKANNAQLKFTNTVDQARKILLNYEETIKTDMAYSEDELNPANIKKDFIEYYKTDIVPRLETPVKFIRDEAIHWVDVNWDSELDIVFWTEGVWPSYGGVGQREILYVVEMKNDLPLSIMKKKMALISQEGLSGKYKTSMFFKYPNKNCGYNDFVRGLLIIGSYGASGSASTRYLINYNKYDQRVEIDEESSSIFLVPQSCK